MKPRPLLVALLCALGCALAVPAQAQAQAQAQILTRACTMVFGSGHNAGDAQTVAEWDARNRDFSEGARARLQDAGWPTDTYFAPLSSVPPAVGVQQMLALAKARGCSRIVDAAVFEDLRAGTLVARLRLHPLLGSAGPRASDATLEIGRPLYTSQREFELGYLSRLTPERLRALGAELAGELLATP